MFRLAILFIALFTAAGAQKAVPKAPAAVDAALRARVQQFYQAHVDRKYRKADEVVAEDSKDAFYEAQKPTIRGFEVKDVKYSDKFTKAVVNVVADSDFVMPGRGPVPWKRTIASDWKLIQGQWFLVIDTSVVATPFGPAKVRPAQPGAAAAPALPMGAGAVPDMKNILKADKDEVRLTPAAPSADVTLTSSMGAAVKLVVSAPSIPGLTATLDRDALKPKEAARLTIKWQGEGKMPAAPVNIEVGLKDFPFTTQVKVVFSDAQ